jgi:hypothetical protein
VSVSQRPPPKHVQPPRPHTKFLTVPLVEDPRAKDAVADQYDVLLSFARAFDAKKDWPDAQSAYRTAMKIAVLNYVKDPSATGWRDKAEEAERAAVVAGKAAESAPPDAPH